MPQRDQYKNKAGREEREERKRTGSQGIPLADDEIWGDHVRVGKPYHFLAGRAPSWAAFFSYVVLCLGLFNSFCQICVFYNNTLGLYNAFLPQSTKSFPWIFISFILMKICEFKEAR